MNKKMREDEILNILSDTGKVEIEMLSKMLDVSTMTVRRDLASLENKGLVIRTHGGAILKRSLISEPSFSQKESMNLEQKKIIAKEALKKVEDSMVLMLDSGTTTIELARLLVNKNDLTIITNDIRIASVLIESENKVILVGGNLQREIGAIYGPVAENQIEDLYVDILFLGAHAIHKNKGITAPTHEKASIKKSMIKSSQKTWILSDSSKFNEVSFTKVCELETIQGIITDNNLKLEVKEDILEETQIVIAEG